MAISRRGVLGVAAAGVASILNGCGRSARSSPPVASADKALPTTSPLTSPRTSPPLTSLTARSSVTPQPSATAGRLVPAVEFAHGPRTRNEVALTFHGAGDLGIARELLAIFADHHARVTVLGVGTWLAQSPIIAGEIVAAGHELGNHTYSHLDIDNVDVATARSEIVRCRDLLKSLVGSGGAHFRQSQAQSATARIRLLAGQAGYSQTLSYDIDSLDYTDPGVATVRRAVASARAGSIVSMHFGHRVTVQAMPRVLDDLTGRGLRPVTASTLLRP